MTDERNTSEGGGARRVSCDVSSFLDAPIELLREQALARGKVGSPACELIARMFRRVASEIVFGGRSGDRRGGSGSGFIPSGLTREEAAQRATDLLNLADELDGLDSGRPGAGR